MDEEEVELCKTVDVDVEDNFVVEDDKDEVELVDELINPYSCSAF